MILLNDLPIGLLNLIHLTIVIGIVDLILSIILILFIGWKRWKRLMYRCLWKRKRLRRYDLGI